MSTISQFQITFDGNLRWHSYQEIAGGFFRNGTIFLNVLREFYDPTGSSSLRPTDEALVESKYIKGGRKGGIPRNLLNTLAHEVQHSIQRIEGLLLAVMAECQTSSLSM
jgi:hypothetical protein